jgi:hypothetical protein
MNLPFGIDAMVVNTVKRGPRQMAGMGDSALLDIVNGLTGGEVTAVQTQLNTLELMLKVSIAASIVAGIAGLSVLLSGRR